MRKRRVYRKMQSLYLRVCILLLLLVCVTGAAVFCVVDRAGSSDAADSELQACDSLCDCAAVENTKLSANDTEETWVLMSVEKKLDILREVFPSEKYWNHREMSAPGDTFLCVSDAACDHSQNGYRYCNQYQGAMRILFPDYSGVQCFGYASLISDLLFGADAPVSEHQDIDRIQVGDHIRFLFDEHSVIVTGVERDEEGCVLYIYVTECNSDYENCRILWGRQIPREGLINIRICTRYSN